MDLLSRTGFIGLRDIQDLFEKRDLYKRIGMIFCLDLDLND